MGIQSALRVGIQNLPDKVKKESVENLLRKSGVKEDELIYSGVREGVKDLPTDEKGRVSKKALDSLERTRTDIQVVETDEWTEAVPDPFINSPATSRIYTSSDQPAEHYTTKNLGQPEARITPLRLFNAIREDDLDILNQLPDSVVLRAKALADVAYDEDEIYSELWNLLNKRGFRSEHFQEVEVDYLLHTRVVEDSGHLPTRQPNTRVVTEIQSDLHQQGRLRGSLPAGWTVGDYNKVLDEYFSIIKGSSATVKKNELASNPVIKEYLAASNKTVDMLTKEAFDTPLPTGPWKDTWLRRGLEQEFTEAVNRGQSFAVLIKGESGSDRPPGVEKWYQTRVADTVRKMAAKDPHIDFNLLTHNYRTYVTLDYNKSIVDPKTGEMITKASPDYKLYTSPAAAAFVGYQMYREGFSESEIEQQLASEGFESGEINSIFTQINAIGSMAAEGYSDAEIQKALGATDIAPQITEDVEAELKVPEDPKLKETFSALISDKKITAQELISHAEVMEPLRLSVMSQVSGFLGNTEDSVLVDAATEAQRDKVIQIAADRGLDISFDEREGEWIAHTEQGDQVVTPEWYVDFWNSKGEFLYGGAAGMVGLRLGFATGAKTAAVLAPAGPLVAGAGAVIVGGATAAGTAALGAMLGTELDYLQSALELQKDLEAEAMARKALTAAEVSVYTELAAAGVIKISGSAWRGAVNAVNSIKKNTKDRAITSLQETFFITKEEAEDLAQRLENVAEMPVNKTERAITAIANTRAGGEALVRAAAAIDPRASKAVAKSVDDRAKDVLAATRTATPDDIHRIVREDLEGYKQQVQDQFKFLKQGTQGLKGFRFDYDSLVIEPTMASIAKGIKNPDVLARFANQHAKIRDYSESRSMASLLDLHKMVKEFKFNKALTESDQAAIDTVLFGLDKEIARGARQLPDPESWINGWKRANKDFDSSLALQSNVLAKLVAKPGVTEEGIAKAMLRYAPAIDSTYVDVLSKLPKKTRAGVEGSMIDLLAKKYTVGDQSGVQAINFVDLHSELQKIPLTSPENRSLRAAIGRLSEVFRNDVPLQATTGGINLPVFKSYLTTDPAVRAQYAAATQIFNKMEGLKPTATGRLTALVNKTAKLLETPTNAKSLKELQDEIAGDFDVNEELEELVKLMAKANAEGTRSSRVVLYGSGKILSTKGSGTKQSIPLHRIASIEQANNLAKRYGFNPSDTKLMDIELKKHGFRAVQYGTDRVRLLGD